MTSTHFFIKRQLLLSILTILLIAETNVFAQKKEKIQIVLLGTFHITPLSSDMYKNKKIDLHSSQKEKEIQEVVGKLVKFKPNQICLEYPMEDQKEMDSIYNAYKKGIYKLADNERDLFGFQAVKKLGISSPTCINYSFGRFEADTAVNFAAKNNQNDILESLQKGRNEFANDIDKKLTDMTLRDFLIYCNTKEALDRNLGLYTQYFSKIGKDKIYVGADLVADWYSTNIHIYTNILRIIKPSDKRIVVLLGQGHIPILKHLFSSNPDFEVVEVKDILK